jgi:hypothetical protein
MTLPSTPSFLVFGAGGHIGGPAAEWLAETPSHGQYSGRYEPGRQGRRTRLQAPARRGHGCQLS